MEEGVFGAAADMPREKIRRDSRGLWEEIFSEDSASFLDYYDREKSCRNWIQTRYEGDRLVSMIHWNPVTLRYEEKLLPGAYLIAVATRPERRHRGFMAGLLREGLQQMQKKAHQLRISHLFM